MSDFLIPPAPVAVIGVGALLPGSTTVEDAWRSIVTGRDLITDVPPTHWLVEDYYDPDPAAADKTYGRRGAFLDPVGFDALAFGIPPNTIEATDTTQLLALITAEKVLEDATGGRLSELDRDRVSVILGTSALELLASMSNRMQRPVWLKAMREGGVPEAEAQQLCDRIAGHYVPWQEASFPGMLSNVVAGRIASRFDLRGTNCTTDAACASSLSAISAAVNELTLGHSDLAITGGVDTLNDITMYMCFSKTPALSPTGDCRPFSAAADGTILGEALVMFALKRLADAERDGDRIYSVIRGIGTASDGRSKAIYAPLPQGQARALRRAYAQAGYGPETVELIEAHGTGTSAGDAAEVAALQTVFAESGRSDERWCALGSIKSQIGHTKSAAGAAGLLKAVLALHHKVLPPTIKVDRPNPELDLERGPLYLNTEARPWIRDAGHPRRASVSSFGFGGSNFHVALEEYQAEDELVGRTPWRARTASSELLLLSATSPADLLARVAEVGSRSGRLADLARRTQREYRPGDAARLAVVATDTADLAGLLRQAAELIDGRPDAAFSLPTGVHYATGEQAPGRVAFVFPGQGSQYVGMGAEVAMEVPAARLVWDRAAGMGLGDQPLHRVVFPVPAFADDEREAQEATLTATDWAQPALAVQSLALLRVLEMIKLAPDCVAGHSFGELAALHAAGAYDADALVRLARARGTAVRDGLSAPGAMLAVSAGAATVEAILARCGARDVWLANHNAPEQVLLSGRAEQVAEAARVLAAEGLTVRRLCVSGGFHTPLVAAASRAFLDHLRGVEIRTPNVEVFSNDGTGRFPDDPDGIRRTLAEHMVSPVRFVDQIETMYEQGVRTFVEVGAGSALTALIGQILGTREHLAVNLDRRGRRGMVSLHIALGRLSVAGVAMDLEALWAPHAPPEDEAEVVRPRMTTPLLGANYGKPYPPAGGAAQLPPPNHTPATPAVPPFAAASSPGRTASIAPVETGTGSDVVPHSPAAPVPHAATGPSPLTLEVPPLSVEQPLSVDPPPTSALDAEWLRAFTEAQRQATETHAAYQRTMGETHLAFLRMAEISLAGLSGLVVPGAPASCQAAQPVAAPASRAPLAPARLPSVAPIPDVVAVETHQGQSHWDAFVDLPVATLPGRAPAGLASGAWAPADLAPAHLVPGAWAPADLAPAHLVPVHVSRANVPPAHVAPTPETTAPPVAAGSGVEVESVLLAVVADKTGYPVEMLAAEMELEADLGIDSIKRVEILSAFRQRVPGLAEVDVAVVGRLRSLGEIVEHLREQLGGSAKPRAGAGEPRAGAGRSPVPAPTGSAARSVGEQPRLTRQVIRAVPAPAPGLALPGLHAGPVLVTDDGAGIAEQLVGRLAEHGVQARVAREVPADARAVVFLGGLREIAGPSDARAIQREAFQVARTIAPGVAASGGVFVTVQDTGGDFGLGGRSPDRAWLGGLAGLARTAAREWPPASVKAIDCARRGRDAAAIAADLARELTTGGSAGSVGLGGDGGRVVLASAAAAAEPGRAGRIGPESVIVVSGGARGVTAATVRSLARAHRPRLVLLGRTRLVEEPAHLSAATDEAALRGALIEQAVRRTGQAPAPARINAAVAEILAVREVRGTLESVRAAGSEVRYLTVDARDGRALTAALDGVRRDWGPITGIVHGAGVVADKLIADKTDEQFDRVFDTKVGGLHALLDATAADPLTVLCTYSSVAAYFGNPGQCDYAMANEVLNHVACAQRAARPDCLVRSIGWGPWDGGMVSPDLARHFRQRDVALIPLEAGADAFVAELDGTAGDVSVLLAAGSGAGPLAGPLAGPAAAAVRGELHVSDRSYPELADHDIAGTPVVPIALVLEWFAAAATAAGAAAGTAAGAAPAAVVLHDVRVLRKIGLDRFANGGNRLVVDGSWTTPDHSELALRLLGEADTRHYQATARPANGTGPGSGWGLPAVLRPLARTGIYDGQVLFHGPAFQAIRTLHGVAPAGAAAVLAGGRELGWREADWRTDPAALDGGLQLAVLWAEPLLGGGSLPMGVRALRVYTPGLLDGPVHCVVRAAGVHGAEAECDIAFLDSQHTVCAELLGVRLVRRPA